MADISKSFLKHLGFSIAGTFAFVGAATVINAAATPGATTTSSKQEPLRTSTTESQITADQTNNDSTLPKEPNKIGTNSTSISSTTINGITDTHITINGKDIKLPANSNTHQTVISKDGSTTTVTSTSNSSSQGSTTNSSSTSFSLHVENHSST